MSAQVNMTPQNVDLATLRQYFASEYDKLSSLLPAFPTGLSKSFAQSSNKFTSTLRADVQETEIELNESEVSIQKVGEKLKTGLNLKLKAS